jgi:hypothetical protein
MRKAVITAVVMSTFLLVTGTAWAQQVTLGLTPPLLEVAIQPGKSILVAYRLENVADPTIMTARVVSFEPKGVSGQVSLKDEREGPLQFTLDNADISLEEPFFMKGKSYQQILLRMRVPEGAPEGDYYYTLLGEAQPPPAVEGTSASRASATIGANIIVTVTQSGETEVKGTISLFDLLTTASSSFLSKFKIFDSNDKIPVVLQLQNTGKNVIRPEGEITLKGNFGEKATYTIVPQNVLKESQRVLAATPSATIDCSEAKFGKLCTTPYTVLLSGFFIGNYRLSTTLNFGEGTPNLYASASFIAIPLKLLIGLAAAILIAVILIQKLGNSREE